MTRALPLQLRKELRELLPWWAAIVAGMLACWVLLQELPPMLDDRHFTPDGRATVPPASMVFGLFAYAGGAIALGALSLGQEYSHGTLSGLLVQPASRARLLLTKFAVLWPMLLGLAALAMTAFASDPWFGAENSGKLLMLCALPFACGLFLAPWMTMACGGPLAGAVFGGALPSLLWVVGSYFHVPFDSLWQATMALAGLGALMTWRAFMTLRGQRWVPGRVGSFDRVARPGDHRRGARSCRSPLVGARQERVLAPAGHLCGVGRLHCGLAGGDYRTPPGPQRVHGIGPVHQREPAQRPGPRDDRRSCQRRGTPLRHSRLANIASVRRVEAMGHQIRHRRRARPGPGLGAPVPVGNDCPGTGSPRSQLSGNGRGPAQCRRSIRVVAQHERCPCVSGVLPGHRRRDDARCDGRGAAVGQGTTRSNQLAGAGPAAGPPRHAGPA
ncbi:MAG: ABC transporter permease subunit [Acidobacteria bacterium]|nr:ABC transporter permease subunit [Acidobacteriota bacterium]